MSNEVIGTVGYVSPGKAVGAKGSKIYSFKVDGDERWFGTGFEVPTFNKGDMVKFTFTDGKYGPQVEMKDVQTKAGAAPAVSQGTSAASAGGGSRDDYWAKKEAYDRDVTAKMIHYQASTNVAKDLVIAALTNGILPTPGKNKDAKWENYLAMVWHVRDEVYSQYDNALSALRDGESLVRTAQEQAPQEAPSVGPAEAPDDAPFVDDDPWT